MSHFDSKEVFGATACVVFQFNGTLDELAAELADALNLKSFTVEASQDPPHRRIGSAEAMGFEAWLEEVSTASPREFRLRIESEHSLKESFEGKMYDLSPWYARLISTLCDVKAQPAEQKPEG